MSDCYITDKISEIKSFVSESIREMACDCQFPASMIFQESVEFPKYKVTVEVIQIDEYVDKNGNKWKRVVDDY